MKIKFTRGYTERYKYNFPKLCINTRNFFPLATYLYIILNVFAIILINKLNNIPWINEYDTNGVHHTVRAFLLIHGMVFVLYCVWPKPNSCK